MGCGGSKVDDLPLVTLCRERKHLIKAASEYRYALAASHVAYFHSLRDVGDSLRRFVDEDILIASPVLTLPSHEGKNSKSSSSSSSSSSISLSHSLDHSHNHNHDHADNHKKKRVVEEREIDHGHLNLSSSGSDSDSDSDLGHVHDIHVEKNIGEEEYQQQEQPTPGFYGSNSPIYPVQDYGQNPYPYPYTYPYPYSYQQQPSYYGSNTTAYYMRKAPTPAKTVIYEDPSTSGYSGSDYYGNGGYFGYGYPMPSPRREPSPPKPPPSPPRVSTWDFLNVFETFENGGTGYPSYYPTGGRYSTTSSPDSKEVREREGIPDLEDETEQEASVKGAYKRSSNQEEEVKNKFGEGTSKNVAFESNGESYENVKGKGVKTSSSSPDTFRSPTESLMSKSTSPEETHYVKKKGVSFEVEDGSGTVSSGAMDAETSSKPTTTTNNTTTTSSLTTLSGNGTRDLQEVVKEIRDEFEVATGCGKEVALMLEVGKLPYQRRSTSLKVILSRILYLVSSHPPATQLVQVSSRVMKMAKAYSAELGNHMDVQPKNLTSTLAKLYEWEKKLYKEVKDEERLRVIYEKKCKRLRSLDNRGAESSKIDAEQASIRKILTKINVCIRAIDSISSKIYKLRDEELQPQIAELVQRFTRMWNSMLKCHQKQFQAIMESKARSLKANTGLQTDSGLKATVELEMELINWATRFTDWINTQKSYIESLNEWLSKCLLQEPEETADGFAPFSPSRAGAPPIFVICNDWFQAMESISEKGVQNALIDFATRLHELWERQGAEQRQRIKTEYLKRDFEKQLRTLRMERGRIEQEQDALSDKTISKVTSESGVSPLDDLKVDLDSMKKKLQEERAKQKEAAKLVHAAASSSIQAGLIPIFEALGNFSAEVLKAHEQVRLEYAGGS